MKAILITAVIMALLFGLGWMSFTSNDGNSSVTIDTNKVKEDTSKAVEKSKEIVEEGIDKLKGATSDDKNPEGEPVPSQPESGSDVSGNEVVPIQP